MIPQWMRVLYLYLLSGKPGFRADNLVVHTDLGGKHWVNRRWTTTCVNKDPSIQEFLDGLQNE